ncbi:MAG TPA: adenosine deaminase [Elusimicrobia bacterium]|nr:MAG: adenosine deaminase [Elusimicrobia bacterium GWA2_64_40]OGR65810.1 MAG: adenosine deaminase [Elusimicrobia bacterium GWB2_63_16]HAN05579.1 adenosine deaminase [Elusimicrobiota bacterium]HAU88777.1 adenosine deaminase [Elusimicrobiota bacterium]
METTADRILALPKAELHRHVEGCVRLSTILDLAAKYKFSLPSADPAELDRVYRLRAPGASLTAVLGMFGLAQACFASYEAVERITFEALEDAYKKENIRLLELRYSPDFMLGKAGLDWQRAHELIAAVCARFEKDYNMVCGVIVIASRSYGLESARRTVDFAAANRKSVIGFDLADSESDYPSALYAGAVKKLHAEGIPLTVHSGEEGPYSQVSETIKALAPRRIGHGVKAADDRSGRTVELVKRAGVTIETNPWSNYLTRAVPSVEAHPLKSFLDAGVKCTIGADDPEILATDLNHEYRLAVERMGLSFEDIRRTLRWAVEGSFLSPDRRQQAAKELGL